MKFNELALLEPFLKAIKEKKYEDATEIQIQSIPKILDGDDILGGAQTGTGKTAAFAIPILQNIFIKRQETNHHRRISALVLTPTRELAMQVADSFIAYGKYSGLKATAIYGGVPQYAQVKKLVKGVDVLVATPGRLLDLIDQGFIRLKHVDHFVLDEADRMLDMGFIHEIKKVIKLLPNDRQSLFFSATLTDNVLELSKKIVNNPQTVEVTPTVSTAETVQQMVYYTNKDQKRDMLEYLIDSFDIDQTILFSRTKYGSDKLVRFLKTKDISAIALHGDKSQHQRQTALKRFKNGEVKVLVATDIAARGIDISDLKFVINYDIPEDPEAYVHRIGRTGRAGEEGFAISICEPEHNYLMEQIEKFIGQGVPLAEDNPYIQTDIPMTPKQRKDDKNKKIEHRKNLATKRRQKMAEQRSSESKPNKKLKKSPSEHRTGLKNAAPNSGSKNTPNGSSKKKPKKNAPGSSGFAAKRKKANYRKKFGG